MFEFVKRPKGLRELIKQSKSLKEAEIYLNESKGSFISDKAKRRCVLAFSQLSFPKEQS